MKMMRNLFGAIVLIITFSTCVLAQNGHNIKVKVNGIQNQDLYLAYYFGDKQYISDTIQVDADGRGEFKGEEPLEAGIYLVVVPPENKYFEMIVNEQEFSAETDIADLNANLKVTGSKENDLFIGDRNFIADRQKEKKKFETKREAAKQSGNQKEVAKIDEQAEELNDAVIAHRKKLVADNPGSFYGAFIKMLEDPELPETPEGAPEGYAFYQYRKHYFDNIDLSDHRMIRTPVLDQKVKYFLEKMYVQVADSLIIGVDRILQAASKNEDAMRYWLPTMLNKFSKSKIMCLDKVYVHVGLNYYAKGMAPWLSSADSLRIVKRAQEMQYTLCGEVAPNLVLRGVQYVGPDGTTNPDNGIEIDDLESIKKLYKYDTNGSRPYNLRNIDADYTMLYFYDPDCGHCKKETPKFKAAWDTLKTQYDIEVMAISVEQDYDKWIKFIQKFGIKDWINVADIELRNHFREIYDIQSTPRIFLLDKNKIIKGKRFSHDQLGQLLEGMEKEKKREAEKGKG